jgi:cytochrome P450
MNPELDLAHPVSQIDPFPVYRRLREEDPVHWSTTLRMWVLTRYEDVDHVLHQPLRYSVDRFRRIDADFLRRRPDARALATLMRDWAVYRDPPDHTRLRGLLGSAFARAQIERMQPRIQTILNDLLDRVADRGRMEFLADVAFPLPATVIASMLGAPAIDMAQIKIWSDQIAAYIGGAQAGMNNIDEARQGLERAREYFRDLVGERGTTPRDDLISLMLAAEDRGAVLSEDEVVANCVLLLFAGHETTKNLLGNGLYHLLRHPEQHRRLRATPALAPTAVEEFLRYDPPVTGTIRVATEDVELHGRHIAAGQLIAAFLSSANRDPDHFERPDDLDVAREPHRHLAFGQGIHFCLGATLAKLEVQLTLRTLFERFEDLTLVDEAPPWKPQIFFRGLRELPIAFRLHGGA